MFELWNLSQGRYVYPACLRVSYPALLSAVAVPLSSCCRDPSVCSKLKLPPPSCLHLLMAPMASHPLMASLAYTPGTTNPARTCSAYTPFSSEGCYQPFILASTHDLLVLAMLVSCEACVGYQWALVKNLHIFRPSILCSILRSAFFC